MKDDIVYELQDYTDLTWAKVRRSSGTAGSFMKAYSDLGGKRMYYKLSDYDPVHGIVGHECVNELIVDRLLTCMGIDHLHYQLIHALVNVDGQELDTWMCASENYRKAHESKMGLDDFFLSEKYEKETPLAFCIRRGWEEYIDRMLAVDYIIQNRDRHGANVEVLLNRKSEEIRLAPLFDHGLSLIFSCHTEKQAVEFDVMYDRAVQCFVGSRSTFDNLSLIRMDDNPIRIPYSDEVMDEVMNGLDGILSETHQSVIRKMIRERWLQYESFRDQR